MNPFSARKERLDKIKEHKIDELRSKLGDIEGRQGGGDEGEMQFKVPEGSNDYEAENFDKYLPKAALENQAPPEWSGGRATQQYEPPSRGWQCAYKLQNGFVIGASLGSAIGFLYGTWAAIAYRHVLYLPIAVVQSGGAFGLFLACGTVIRCDEPDDGLTPLQRASCMAAAASAAARPALTGVPRRASTSPSSVARECVARVEAPRRSAVLAAVVASD